MKKIFKNIKATYIFSVLSILLIVGTISIYKNFEKISMDVKQTNLNSHIGYIDNLTSNIADIIKKSTNKKIYKTLNNDTTLRDKLEENLRFLITNRYRYIYVVDKENTNSKEFRFLLDGSKKDDEKSEFGEYYNPLNFEEWNKIYKTKKPYYYKHNEVKNIWMTYLKPIIINDKVEAIIVVDFSLKEHNIITSSLNNFDSEFEMAILLLIFILILLIIFSFFDYKREKQKELISLELEKKNKEIVQFNETLQDKIKIEVQKNRDKDQQMIEQSRLAQMGEMISMIAHQWRQPLAAISSTSGAINIKAKLNKLDNEIAQELSTKISSYSQHLSSTIDDFREFFKSNKEKKESTYDDIIESVLKIIENSIVNKNIQIIKEFNSDKVFNTYPNELKQVVLNLLKNAEDALQEVALGNVLLEKSIKNPKITITTKDNILTIQDNGGGVPEDIISKIFDPYFSTKTKKDGTGLGLYMSKTIIEEHCGGELSVLNDKDGAVFTIKLVVG